MPARPNARTRDIPDDARSSESSDVTEERMTVAVSGSDQVRQVMERRYGGLILGGYDLLPSAFRTTRRDLGLSATELLVIESVLRYAEPPKRWGSASQETLGKDAGFSRQAVNKAVGRLRARGLLAVKPDERHGRTEVTRSPTFRYCLEPYIAVVVAVVSQSREPHDLLVGEAHERIAAFASDVKRGEWEWQFGRFRSDTCSIDELRGRFDEMLDALSLSETQVSN